MDSAAETEGSTDGSDGNTTGVRSPSYLFNLFPTPLLFFFKLFYLNNVLNNDKGQNAKAYFCHCTSLVRLIKLDGKDAGREHQPLV